MTWGSRSSPSSRVKAGGGTVDTQPDAAVNQELSVIDRRIAELERQLQELERDI